MLRLRAPLLSFTISLCACTDGPAAEDVGTESGDEPDAVTLVVDADPSGVCGEFGGSVELVTRRVDCWDPSLPCTVAQDPPWVAGTTDNCSTLVPGVTRWEVTVSQTGRWETRLQAGGSTTCFGVEADGRTNVSRDDLTNGAELLLPGAAADSCDDP